MAKGMGIAAVIIAVLGAFIPVIGFWIGIVALLFATIAALAGDRVFAIVTIAVSIVVFVFLTPSLWIDLAGSSIPEQQGHAGDRFVWIFAAFVGLGAPVLGLILHATGKVMLGNKSP